jgi:hypothetical protein
MTLEEDLNESAHPDWFYRDLIEDALPWQQGVVMSFDEFNQKYTLHDSYWIGAFFDVAYEPTVTLAISWDAVWLPDEIKQSTSIVDDWPYLFIQLSEVEQLSPSSYGDMMDACRTISGCEVEVVDGKKLLAIDDVYGGHIHIVYQGQEVFLALEKNKHRLEI